MLARVKAWIDKHQLIGQGDNLVVAFSGGADSLTLLHTLLALKDEYQINVIAAHVNHMFRGAESDSDEDFVKKHCYKCGIICYTKSINVPEYINRTGMSAEEAARKLRYQYLREVAQTLGAHTKIATGHHRDDQAETVLLNLMRGAGSAGLRGMKPLNGDIIRPLLCLNRQEIEQFCRDNSLEPRIDSTNFSCDYLRNRVRLKLMPQLEETFSKGVKDALCRTAQLVGDEHDFILAEVRKLWPKLVKESAECISIDTTSLEAVHIAVLRELFRKAIAKKRGHIQGISFNHVENLIEFSLAGSVGKIFQLPGEIIVTKGYKDIKIGLPQEATVPSAVRKLLAVPGTTEIPELKLLFDTEILYSNINTAGNSGVIVFDYQQLIQPLCIRTRAAGDRFWPKGMNHNKKLKDFFIDCKVPRKLRDVIPLLCDGQGRILWVVGYRASALCQPNENTTDFLKITLNK